ncbi:MAG: hypothetical protein LBF15_03325 [Candidatus Peribacteria bacterium]|nr:hypothetical protein [Candidatus Peribacteria bacterium]
MYSVSLKLSVEAKITSFHLMFTYNQAKVGLMFPSALENRVLLIDFLITSHKTFKLTSSLIVGIIGNSLASSPFMINFQLHVDIFMLVSFNSSIFISSSSIRFT